MGRRPYTHRVRLPPAFLNQLRSQLQAPPANDDATSLEDEAAQLEAELSEVVAEGLMKAAPAMELLDVPDDGVIDFLLPDRLDAEITEEAQTPLMSARTRYRLEIRADGAHHRVRLHDFEYLEINGEDVTGADRKLMLARARAAAASIPELVVSPSGQFVSLAKTEAMIESLAAMGADLSPQRLLAIEPLMAKFWFAWFASWRGVPLGAGSAAGTLGANRHLLGRQPLRCEADWSRGPAPDLGTAYRMYELGSTLSAPAHADALNRAVLIHVDEPEEARARTFRERIGQAELRLLASFEPLSGLPAVVGRVSRGVAGASVERDCSEVQLWSFDWDL